MTKKANYTVLQRFRDGGNDFQLFSPFPRHNKSADSFMHNADCSRNVLCI